VAKPWLASAAFGSGPQRVLLLACAWAGHGTEGSYSEESGYDQGVNGQLRIMDAHSFGV